MELEANHYLLRHTGWEKCGPRLTSEPRETSSVAFLNEPIVLFRYLANSGGALLSGVLPLRYCATRFACRFPTSRLPLGTRC